MAPLFHHLHNLCAILCYKLSRTKLLAKTMHVFFTVDHVIVLPLLTLVSTLDTTLIGCTEEFVVFIIYTDSDLVDSLLILHFILMETPIPEGGVDSLEQNLLQKVCSLP